MGGRRRGCRRASRRARAPPRASTTRMPRRCPPPRVRGSTPAAQTATPPSEVSCTQPQHAPRRPPQRPPQCTRSRHTLSPTAPSTACLHTTITRTSMLPPTRPPHTGGTPTHRLLTRPRTDLPPGMGVCACAGRHGTYHLRPRVGRPRAAAAHQLHAATRREAARHLRATHRAPRPGRNTPAHRTPLTHSSDAHSTGVLRTASLPARSATMPAR